ncbi:TlpA family protein disulfide reductase [Sphingobacterium bambusae]|uniref:TlpA family protein disulfide reductase n=1 Tax=Sphingobacterium bambusae TaxID=662858 RepID=A0ABW6BFJ0_9SPHI|nr:TlpA disulfide reductase family protein [Sphingobacterium bambusae]WPL47104.1 TlpA disulfide reductase family protein [Sphingobacterium bambusae]
MKNSVLIVLFSFSMLLGKGQEWKVFLTEVVPSFKVLDKQGKSLSIDSLRGKVVLINFFATWCPPCRQELPRLQKEVWERWGHREDFAVMVLAREEGWDKLDPFIENTGYTFPIFPDLKRDVFSLFAESQIPRNVLLDKEGKIIYQSIGYTPEEFTAFIELIEDSLAH